MNRDHACFLPEEVWSEDRDQVPRYGQETIRSRNIRRPTQLRRSTTCDTQRKVSACCYLVMNTPTPPTTNENAIRKFGIAICMKLQDQRRLPNTFYQ